MTAERPFTLIHEADDWYAIAKPARLAAHSSARVQDRVTVASLLKQQFNGARVHLVHRLDRAASGVLLVARTPEATRRISAALSSPQTTKRYLALVRGYFRWDDPVRVDRAMADDNGFIKDCVTEIRSLGRSHDPRCSLLEARPSTGRFHQVRRHCRDLNHPLLRDAEHGDSRANSHWRDTHGLQRLGLHCAEISLATEDGPIVLRCPPPRDLHSIWSAMPWWDAARTTAPELLDLPALDLLWPMTPLGRPAPWVPRAEAPRPS